MTDSKQRAFLSSMSIKNKLIIIGVLISGLGLSIFGLGTTAAEVTLVKHNMLSDLAIQAKIIGQNSTASLTFDDPKSAEEILSALKVNPSIDYCVLYTTAAESFATYSRPDGHKKRLIPFSKIETEHFGLDYVSVYQEITLDGKVLGGVYIQSNLDELFDNILYFSLFLLGAVFLSLLGSYAVSQRLLQKTVTEPIIKMVKVMQTVSKEKDYAVRASVESSDELGQLAEGFNAMLSQIQMRDVKLEEHGQDLLMELSARKKAERSALKEKERAQMYLDIAGVAIVGIAVDETVILVNKKCCTLLGVDEKEILGKNWFEHFVPHQDRVNARLSFIQLISGEVGNFDYFEYMVLTKRGDERLVAWHNTRIIEEGGEISAVLSSGEDVTEQRKMETDLKTMNQQLETLSVTDGLSGLFNHRYFYNRLNEEIKRAERFGHPLSVIILDIDFFKNYNDTQGHLMGDEVLRDIAVCLNQSIREQDVAARYGGEEFTVILPETDRTSVREIAERIRHTVEVYPFLHKESQPNGNLTVSLGCATYPYDAKDAVGLTQCSDDALYKAKEGGRNRVCAWDETMQ
jgi:diguanylate cyclase (GGDEF)-like protein/PAS domain S-box-containing protein